MTRLGDLVGVIEAAYAHEPSEEEWLFRLASSVQPLLGRGFGTAAFTFASDVEKRLALRAFAFAGVDDETRATVLRTHAVLDSRSLGVALRAPVDTFISASR